MNTIDESVWDTLRRDLLAVWEKMRQVLYPKYLLGGLMNRSHGAGVEGGEGEGLVGGGAGGAIGQIRGLVGRLPDADAVLQGNMSEGLRDWDLWYAIAWMRAKLCALTYFQGSAALLPPTILPAESQCPRRSALPRLQRRVRHDLDCRSDSHTPDKTPRRQHVRIFKTTSVTPLVHANLKLAPSSNPSAS